MKRWPWILWGCLLGLPLLVFLSTFFIAGGLPRGWVVLSVILIGLDLYFLPTLLAVTRRSSTAAAAIVVDVFLGWSVIGWVVALALAVSDSRRA